MILQPNFKRVIKFNTIFAISRLRNLHKIITLSGETIYFGTDGGSQFLNRNILLIALVNSARKDKNKEKYKLIVGVEEKDGCESDCDKYERGVL